MLDFKHRLNIKPDAANDAHAGYTLYVHLHDLQPTINPTYYTFHAIRGHLYEYISSNALESAQNPDDVLWGLSSTLKQWFAFNPDYDPGPPPEAKKQEESVTLPSKGGRQPRQRYRHGQARNSLPSSRA